MTAPSHDDNLFADLIPDDPIMAAAWLGGLRYTITRDDWVAEFRQETGKTWTPAKSGIEAMIDETTGYKRDFFRSFAEWYDENIWGPLDGPDKGLDDESVPEQS